MEGEPQAPAKRKPGRPPTSPEAREKASKRAAVRRMLQRLESAADADELLSKVDELRREQGKPEPKSATGPVREVEGEALEPGQRPGWPAPSLVARYYPVALDLWRSASSQLEGTDFALSVKEVEVVDHDGHREVHRLDPIETLAAASAPVLAKRVPEQVTSPEAGLALALATVFLPPLMRAGARWLARLMAPAPPPDVPEPSSELEERAAA